MGDEREEDELWSEPLWKFEHAGLEGSASQGWTVVIGWSPHTLDYACLCACSGVEK